MMLMLRALLEMTVTASVMIGIVLAIRMCLSKRMNPTVMIALWALVLLRLCLPFTIASPVHLDDLMPKQAATEQVNTIPQIKMETPNIPAAPLSYPSVNIPGQLIAEQATPHAAAESSIMEAIARFITSIPIWSIITGIWALGALLVLALTIRKAWLFRRKLRVCKPITDGGILRAIKRHRRNFGVKKSIQVLECDFVQVPTVLGYFKPFILLPAQFVNQMDKNKLNSILLHEMCHIKRHDMLMNYLWLLVKAVHWFNPLVWMAYKYFQSDIELCRDQMVVNRLGQNARLVYSQSLIESIRFVKKAQNSLPSVAASLFENKSKVKERVIRMVRPQKRSRASLVVSTILAMLMLISCFTTACQKTPTELIVQQKSKDDLNKAVQQTATISSPGSTPNSISQVNPNSNMVVLEHWTQTVKNDKGTSTLKIDADVNVPSGNSLPVIKLVRKQFMGKQLNSIIKAFAGDNRLFVNTQADVLTKEDIMQEIVKVKQDMTDLNSDMATSSGITSLDELKKEGDKEVIRLEELYKAAPDKEPNADVKEFKRNDLAPDTDAVTIMPGGFSIDFGVDGIGQMNIGDVVGSTVVQFESPRCPKQSVIGLGGTRFISNSDVQRYGDDSNIKNPVGFDENKAKETTNKLLGDLCILDMGIYSIEPGRYVEYDNSSNIVSGLSCYQVIIYRCVNNTFLPDITGRQGKDSEQQYAPDIPKESIKIYIDNKGIVKFQWLNPFDAIETVNQNVKILEFEDIKKLFIQQFFNMYSYVPSGDVESFTFNIDKIELSLVLLIEADKKDEYIAVPAWDFYGATLMKYNKQAFEKMKDSMKDDIKKSVGDVKQIQITDNDEVVERLPYTYATINAATGAIINRYLGY